MPKDRFVEARGLTFHYVDWGGRGTPLLLLHGLASNAHIFDLVAPLLARHQRVVALDQRGHGDSSKPETGYDFETVTADLRAILDALGWRRPFLAGHSWGGNVALQFAAEHPDRAAGLVLIDGGFIDLQSDPAMTWERTRRELAPPHLAGMPLVEFKQRIRQFTGKRWSPAVERIVLSNFEILPDQTIRPCLARERHMLILRALWEQRPAELYPRVRCPALLIPAVMAGEGDDHRDYIEHKRANVERARRALPSGRTIWFRDTIHDIPVQRPRKLANAITKFIGENAHAKA